MPTKLILRGLLLIGAAAAFVFLGDSDEKVRRSNRPDGGKRGHRATRASGDGGELNETVSKNRPARKVPGTASDSAASVESVKKAAGKPGKKPVAKKAGSGISPKKKPAIVRKEPQNGKAQAQIDEKPDENPEA